MVTLLLFFFLGLPLYSTFHFPITIPYYILFHSCRLQCSILDFLFLASMCENSALNLIFCDLILQSILEQSTCGKFFHKCITNLILFMFSFFGICVCENNVLDLMFCNLVLQFCFMTYSWVSSINLWKAPSSMRQSSNFTPILMCLASMCMITMEWNFLFYDLLWFCFAILFCTLSLGLWHMHVRCFFINVLEL
jgi:hypothetical protein